MVAVVNGYVCFSGCDVEKAKQGKDPNAKPGEEFLDADSKKKSGFDGQPATVLGGALADLANAVDASSESATANNDTRSRGVNLLV